MARLAGSTIVIANSGGGPDAAVATLPTAAMTASFSFLFLTNVGLDAIGKSGTWAPACGCGLIAIRGLRLRARQAGRVVWSRLASLPDSPACPTRQPECALRHADAK